MAEEYDKEFNKRYDEDLNTTLIFVSLTGCLDACVLTRTQAGLFSAVTSAFIIQVHPQLQPDSDEETAALLRVLIHQMNNTIFGDNIPAVPQWSGPPPMIVHVQAMLYASLAASLFSAFLAMLGKQWLNRYSSTDMRGTSVERGQDRQRKLNGILVWYFNPIMELLPLMLQFALLLLGCALSLYIWGINKTVASVVLGFTSFGVISYAFIVVAGAASVTCPYQTPGAQILRYLWQIAPNCLTFFIKNPPMESPETQPGADQALDQKVAALDFPCISWMLQTSLDRAINQLTLKFLASVLTSPGPGFMPTIVMDCLNMLTGCVGVTNNNQVALFRGSELLAEMAATCLLSALSHSFVVDPESDILKDVCQRYNRVFPAMVDVQGLPFYHTISGIHQLFNRYDYPQGISWKGVDPSAPESVSLSYNLAKITWLCYQREGLERQKQIPHWVLRFPHHCLLWNPAPPTPVIANCLLIVAIDLGCDIPDATIRDLDKRYVPWHKYTIPHLDHSPVCMLEILCL